MLNPLVLFWSMSLSTSPDMSSRISRVSNRVRDYTSPSLSHSLSQSLLAVSPELAGSVSFGGLRAYCIGYAVDTDEDDHVIYLGLVGYRTAVRGVWAALLEHKPIEIAGQLFRRAEGAYLYRAVQLPESGLENMALLHHQATIPNLEPNQTFYLLNDSDEPPQVRFFAMLNRAVVAPLLPHWAEWLWRAGRREKLIMRLDATSGTFAWRIQASDEIWLDIVQRGIRNGHLSNMTHEPPNHPIT